MSNLGCICSRIKDEKRTLDRGEGGRGGREKLEGLFGQGHPVEDSVDVALPLGLLGGVRDEGEPEPGPRVGVGDVGLGVGGGGEDGPAVAALEGLVAEVLAQVTLDQRWVMADIARG